MELVAIVTALALIEAVVFGVLVGQARGRYDVKAPAVTGNEVFERYYRVQANTNELLILFLPALWIFGYYLGQYWAAGIGAVFLVGRILYAITYIRDPGSRALGAILSLFPCWILVIGALIGATISLLGS